MSLENEPSELEGKLVGRVGVEPTTKRLRAAFPNSQFSEKHAQSPLIEALGSASKRPAFRLSLRDIGNALLILAVLAALIAGAVAVWDAPRTDPPTPWASGTDRANPWRGQ